MSTNAMPSAAWRAVLGEQPPPYTHVCSYELDADIPYPYTHLSAFVRRYKPMSRNHGMRQLAAKRHGAAIFFSVSNPLGQIVPNRLGFMQRLNASGVPLHSHGLALRDDRYRKGAAARRGANGTPQGQRHLGTYVFAAAFENSVGIDYVTEKLFDLFAAASPLVPIYHGAPNIADYLPHRDAVIHVSDFDSAEALAWYVLRLAANHSLLWRRHLAWRESALPRRLRQLARLHDYPLGCSLCRCLAANSTLCPRRDEVIELGGSRRSWITDPVGRGSPTRSEASRATMISKRRRNAEM